MAEHRRSRRHPLMVTREVAELFRAIDPFNLFTETGGKVFFGLIFVGIACILMGTGVPTTPTYIILASIAAPALGTLGVPLIATHFFVFYYGVLADVTPPVALAAYAAAGIAGSEPMRTGLTAFRLSMGKALVPFMFTYTPALLFIDFAWGPFLSALVCGAIGIVALAWFPDQRRRLLDEPSLMRRAVDEMLRWAEALRVLRID